MTQWFSRTIVDTGRLPLFFFLLALVGGFVFIRFSTRMIRAEVSWWPGNVTPGGLHLHHVVFGVVFVSIGGVMALAVQPEPVGWRVGAAILFGVGLALVLDEFALIVYLQDVYWSEQGRSSVDAVFVAIALTGLLLLGFRPFDFGGPVTAVAGAPRWLVAALLVGAILLNLALAAITLAKGKFWTGIVGLFIPVLAWCGAIRLATPESAWAQVHYRDGTSKLARARRRDERIRRPMLKAMSYVQTLIAGKPN